MTAIALVVVGNAAGSRSSEEFRNGWDLLHRAVPRQAQWLETVDGSPQGLRQAVLDRAPALPDDGLVLLLPHPHVMLTRVTQDRLCRALAEHPELSAVHAYDSHFPPPTGPDYCTVRGLERYLARLDSTAAPPTLQPDDGSRQPLVSLTRLATLREDRVHSQAAWLSSAFVHDFADYHGGRREEVLPLIPPQARRVLDVGGGEGGFLAALRQARGCETHLAEYSEAACALARPRVDHVWPGDFLTQPFQGLPDQGRGAFDCISFLDVLEHAVDPQAWLVRARTLLAPDGCIVMSIPNVGHWGVMVDLLEGRWDYCPVGIHCITHVRFFTLATIEDLLAASGLMLDAMERVQVPTPPDWAAHWAQTPRVQADPQSWDTYAFLVRARPIAPAA